MIGNDVIDLASARSESNPNRAGFIQKLFTQKERSLIGNASDMALMVWNLWSRKEAAYKVYNRQTGVRAFIPFLLECDYKDVFSGTVQIAGRVYFTQTSIVGDLIHTIAVASKDDFANISVLDRNAKISKHNGIPFLNDSVPVSISHHGRFEKVIALGYNPSLDLSFKNNSANV